MNDLSPGAAPELRAYPYFPLGLPKKDRKGLTALQRRHLAELDRLRKGLAWLVPPYPKNNLRDVRNRVARERMEPDVRRLHRQALALTGDEMISALMAPAAYLHLIPLAQVHPDARPELTPEAVPWAFAAVARPCLSLDVLIATGRMSYVPPRFNCLSHDSIYGADCPCRAVACMLFDDVAQVHDLLDAWDAAHGGTLPRPCGSVWSGPDYDAALDAVGINWRDRAGLTVPRLLRDLRALLHVPAEAGDPSVPDAAEQQQALPSTTDEVYASRATASTPPQVDGDGKPLPERWKPYVADGVPPLFSRC